MMLELGCIQFSFKYSWIQFRFIYIYKSRMLNALINCELLKKEMGMGLGEGKAGKLATFLNRK